MLFFKLPKSAYDPFNYNYTVVTESPNVSEPEETGNILERYDEYCKYQISQNGTLIPQDVPFLEHLCDDIHKLMTITVIIAAILGIPGTIATTLTMFTVEPTPTTIYMKYLSVGNFAVIVIHTTNTHSKYADIQLLLGIVAVFPYLLLTILSFERFLAINYPFIKRQYFTFRNTTLSILLVLLFCVLEFFVISFLEHFTGMTEYTRNFILAITKFGIPGPSMILFSVFTLRGLLTMSKQNQQRFSNSSAGWSGPESSIIFMLIISVLTYILLVAPHMYVHTMWVVSPESWRNALEFRLEMFLVHELSVRLQTFHHASIFYIYVLGTRKFRRSFLVLVDDWCCCIFQRLGCAACTPPSDETDPNGVRFEFEDAAAARRSSCMRKSNEMSALRKSNEVSAALCKPSEKTDETKQD